MNAVKFPVDLTEQPVFRALKNELEGAPRTLFFFWLLWRDLAAHAAEGNPLGRLSPAQRKGFIYLLVDFHFFQDADSASAFVTGPVVASGLLAFDGEDLVCHRFQALNSDLVARSGREATGGRMKAFNSRQAKMEGEMMQLQLHVPGHVFVNADGTPLEHEETQRVCRLIISCDNALLRDRPSIGWTAGLVQLALLVVRKMSDEQIGYVVKKVAMHRTHPALTGMTADKLLPQFETIMKRLE